MLASILLLSPRPVATAPGSDFVTNRMKFKSNGIGTRQLVGFNVRPKARKDRTRGQGGKKRGNGGEGRPENEGEEPCGPKR